MTKFKPVSIVSLLILLFLLAAGCAPASPSGLSNAEVLSVTGNLLTAINTGDYPAFTRDFSAEMLAAFPESEFTKIQEMLHSASGNYISCAEPSLTNNQGFAIYNIRCTYELEDVMVRIVFRIDGTQVEGLFFDSPNLRSSSQ
jgi:hypothetical protein